MVTFSFHLQFFYMAELVQGENEHSDWFPERSEFAILIARVDRSRSDFTDLCSWKDIQKETFWR